MYDYREMSAEERQDVLRYRRSHDFPLHAPPHFYGMSGEYLITAACYEHRHIFETPDDLSLLAEEALDALSQASLLCRAWVVLPNHYHVMLETEDLRDVSEILRRLHSRVATKINGRHNQRGRRVWYRYSDRLIRSERHHWTTINYIHFNPVKHEYVERVSAWPWSSIHDYAETHGKEWIEEMWQAYPIRAYGKGWDW